MRHTRHYLSSQLQLNDSDSQDISSSHSNLIGSHSVCGGCCTNTLCLSFIVNHSNKKYMVINRKK